MTESRAVAVPSVAKPEPAEDDLVAALAEIRDAEAIEAANTVLHDGGPAEDRLALQIFPEEGNAFLLDFFEIAQSEASLEKFAVVLLELGVDVAARGPLTVLLAVMKPPVD